MRRVAVIGCSGAGKSTFARALAVECGLPVIHLDAEYWQPGWQMPTKEAWRARHAALIAGDAWIIDGNFGGTFAARLARADTVVWFDFATALCLMRVVRRTIAGHGRTRPDMAADCPERFDWPFLRYVASFNRRERPRIVEALAAHAGHATLHHLTTPAAVRALRRTAPPGPIIRNAQL